MGETLLEWKNHDKALSAKLWEFLKEEYLVDFSVTCHGQQMKVHKFVLALLFPMLKESLRSTVTFSLDQDLAKNGSPNGSSMIPEPHCLNLDNIADHAEDMDYLIQFAYTGKTIVPNEHADCLMHIAESMEIKSLKDSLGQWTNKSKRSDQIEGNDMTRVRLRPRPQQKKINDQSVDDNTDLDFHSVVDVEESSADSIESLDDFSDYDEINWSKEEKTNRNGPPQKRQGEDNCSKRKLVHRQNSTKAKMKLMKTDSDREANNETSETTMPTDDTVEDEKGAKCPASKQAICLEPKQFVCKTCGKEFRNQSLLKEHRASKCGTQLFVCKYCDYKANRKTTLHEHMKAKHQVDAQGNPLEKNIKCPDCDFVCYAKHQLGYHSRAKHERLGKFKCEECDYTAPYMNQIRKHDRVMHQNMRDYMCEECGKRFTTSGRLSNHVLAIHKGIKLHKCNICHAEYSDKLSFKIHQQRHEGKVEYKFVCHICGHNLRRKFELKTHMNKKHGIDLEGAAVTDRCQLQNVVS